MPTFVLEVGTEELPASFVEGAIEQWQERIPTSLAEAFVEPEAVEVYGTPRRLAVVLRNLPDKQNDRTEDIKGPPVKAAYKDGKPTQAAEGFARKQNVSLDDLEIRDTEKGEFVFVRKQIPGRPTADILKELVPQWIFKLEGKRFMRWGDGDVRFPRPIRWLVALLDDAVLPLEVVSGSDTIASDRISSGHRVLHPEPISIETASDYIEALRQAYIEVDPERRKTAIVEGINTEAKKVSGTAEIPEDLLTEVVHLVEYPTAVTGKFDEEFLILPPEVITTVMVSHQRYFPVLNEKNSKELLPYFITISNGDPAKSEIVAAGNERVIRARLADGEFFYKADCEKPLETMMPKLESVTFQEDLGTVKDKVDRLTKIADRIAEALQLSDEEKMKIRRAAYLCKADLVSQMVYEFPELQGAMGEKYALVSGENAEVAKAIFEHYLPRGADDIFPETLTGQVIGLADRLDTLVSIFGLGMLPSGSSDPFALRRAANAVVNITWTANLELNLDRLLQSSVADFQSAYPKASSELLSQLQGFFLQRIQTLLQDEKSIDYDLVNAVLGENDLEYTERALTDLLDVRDRAEFLQSIRSDKTLDTIYETVNRSTRLAKQGDLDTQQLNPRPIVTPDRFESPAEQAFYDALVKLLPRTEAARQERNYRQLIDALAEIAPTVSEFFDGETSVLVMAEDENVKRNRLNLLGLLRNHARVLADFGSIVKSA
ncbi:MAG: glycine--tRNA ligase subunit beta [Cyanobacteria bacterium SBC]|nr:glycine--tRNA ligase subunit beta [Cyanobacteria bacterium SBC]